MTTGFNLERFQALFHRLGGSAGADLFLPLAAAYAQGHRAYHNAEHIADCLRQLDAVRQLAVQPDLVEAALWYHDVVYDPRANDNEERSAAWAVQACRQAGIADEHAQAIAALILVTKHRELPPTGDATLLVDIDLSILGRDADTFEAYDQGIRKEYSWVPEAEYRAGRSRILAGFLARPVLYGTAWFREQFEQQARRNLAQKLAELSTSCSAAGV